jgi:Protein of unknown function (DUF4244)
MITRYDATAGVAEQRPDGFGVAVNNELGRVDSDEIVGGETCGGLAAVGAACGGQAVLEETGQAGREDNWGRRAYERGMVTAEWAIGVVVAVSLAGLLLLFVVRGPMKELLTGIILKIINGVSAWGLRG